MKYQKSPRILKEVIEKLMIQYISVKSNIIKSLNLLKDKGIIIWLEEVGFL